MDRQGGAPPNQNGWFLSDFYFFHHLLKEVGASQTWPTSENPKDLVEKYSTLAYGNPLEERREVLNKYLLPDFIEVDHQRVALRCARFCGRFVATVRSENVEK